MFSIEGVYFTLERVLDVSTLWSLSLPSSGQRTREHDDCLEEGMNGGGEGTTV